MGGKTRIHKEKKLDTESKKFLLEIPEEIVGERVLLRPYRAGDGDALWDAVDSSREHLKQWMPWAEKHDSPTTSEAVVRRLGATWQLRDDMTYGIWDKQTAELLGGTGLHRIDWNVPRFEIGYWIRKSAEGKGYITESTRLLCGFAFEVLKARRVSILCDSRNHRSAAVPKRLGFIQEGLLRNECVDTVGNLRDTLIFGITDTEWHNRD